MNNLDHLTFLRKHYMKLTKIFFYQIESGKTVQELKELKDQIDSALAEIHRLETEFKMNADNDKLVP